MVFSLAARGVMAACLLFILQGPLQGQAIRFDSASSTFMLEGWSQAARYPEEELNQIFQISVDVPDVPAMLGSYTLHDGVVTFTPQFPLQPGVRYRAVARIPGMEPVTTVVDLPRPDIPRTTVVANVFPTADILPENQLKFYIHFSAPMSRGEAYERIRLLDESGERVPNAFLELGEELWDAETTRFTLFFDPGRIKRGLVPNSELGLAIREGRRYTLVIDDAWQDAEGVPLASRFEKTFTAGPPERNLLDPLAWKVSDPRAESREDLVVKFPRPMDNALLQRELRVLDGTGAVVAGSVRISDAETTWFFSPALPWKAGDYSLQIGDTLADLAGNMVDRPFEIDLLEHIEAPPQGFVRSLPISIR